MNYPTSSELTLLNTIVPLYNSYASQGGKISVIGRKVITLNRVNKLNGPVIRLRVCVNIMIKRPYKPGSIDPSTLRIDKRTTLSKKTSGRVSTRLVMGTLRVFVVIIKCNVVLSVTGRDVNNLNEGL